MATALSGPEFLPAGYLYKRVVARPDWLKAANVREICSVSGCISQAFADYIPEWKHNGFWLFDAAAMMTPIAQAAGVDLSGHRLFYFETFRLESIVAGEGWVEVEPEPSVQTKVGRPARAVLCGFDVVSFSMGNAPECSPLSCNGLAATVPVNDLCLMESLDAARDALDTGKFLNAEPGPYRIMAVYEVPAVQSEA